MPIRITRLRILFPVLGFVGMVFLLGNAVPRIDERLIGSWGIGDRTLATFDSQGHARFYGTRYRWCVKRNVLYLHSPNRGFATSLQQIVIRMMRLPANTENEYRIVEIEPGRLRLKRRNALILDFARIESSSSAANPSMRLPAIEQQRQADSVPVPGPTSIAPDTHRLPIN